MTKELEVGARSGPLDRPLCTIPIRHDWGRGGLSSVRRPVPLPSQLLSVQVPCSDPVAYKYEDCK
jgi:hypothetical protein